jgi:hypothetical protein
MILVFKKKSITGAIAASFLTLTLVTGCSSNVKLLGTNSTASKDNNESVNTTDINKSSTADKSSIINTGAVTNAENNLAKTSSAKDDLQKTLLTNMMSLAKQGKIINSEFRVKTTIIDSVEKKLGKPDSADWIPKAKGMYAVYSKYNVAFGFNKGSQIFEVRSFDDSLSKISLSMVKKAYGAPAYDVQANNEKIIGYTAGSEYKILLVFSKNPNGSNDPVLDHYSVFYPRGTVNMMADDPGRQW